jgi:carboxyl-terminal processing protease
VLQVSLRTLLSTCRTTAIARLAAVLALAAIGGCVGQNQSPSQTGGGLFTRVFGEISDLYLEPVSTRRLAVSGLARLSRLDRSFGVSDSFAGALTVTYDERNIAYYPMPRDGDNRQWGDLVTTLIGEAKRASPKIAALPPDTAEQTVLHGVAAALDRYSRYASPEVAQDQRAARDGFGGIGVTVDPGDALFRVASVTAQGPADRAGIRPEDQIVSVDGVATSGCLHQDVMHRLRGPVGSHVALKVLQPGMSQPRDLRLSRAYVFEQTVTASRSGDILMLRVNSFNHNTTRRIAEALTEARRQPGGRLGGIVLDLRGNPGGLLDQAVSLADLFLSEGPIVSAAGRHPASHQRFNASGNAIAARVPMAVLINGGSASASEIVAAALQDAGRAVVIGSSSYGKGTVQTVLRLPNNGELILTWARLISSSGYQLQQHGVVPTVCTADLADDPAALASGLQRAASVPSSGAALRPRAALDEAGWSELRRLCPARRSHPAVDMTIAERLLVDPTLYSAALQAVPASARPAQTAAAGRAASP